ncbi:sodium/glucose cotransporter 4-like isoform X2 [Gigantopelta aegis]|uniref:sodium/glucose cotransporter 4-like isoform X2 n=1 Tax=Gigantopelta aegis TaxID=1735272 RepID=UPI001B888CCB|nr:sodium/glucose cotransporter 4-like isoform X2 [Gigantopelta aegis]
MAATCQAISSTTSLHWGDVLTIVLYFVVVLIVGIWIGASIFASNIGAPIFVGLAGTAAASGIGGMIFEWHAIPFILMLSWVFVPVLTASGVYTMPEYLKKRYGGKRLRTYISVLSIILYIITKISVEMYAGAVFVQLLLGWSMYASGILVLVFSAVFTMTGGLTAVIFTDTLQTIVLIGGAFVLLFKGISEVGGYDQIRPKYMHALSNTTKHGNTTCGYPREDSFSLLRDPFTSDYPWPGTLIFNIPSDIWFWCSDQIMVQRSLSAKSLTHAKGGSIVAGYLKILPYWLFVIPGMIARIMFPDEVACSDPEVCKCICENPAGCSNIAYPLLVLRILSPGLRGLMLAALFAAVMSTLTSVFNSASSIFTMDLWRKFRSHAPDWELLIVGRVVVVVLVGLAVVWIPIMQAAQGDQLWQYWQMLMSAVGPPWAMVFLMGFFWKRTTEPAAFFGLIAGQLLGFSRLILAFIYPTPPCGDVDDRPYFLKIHFLYIAAMETAVSGASMICISLFTKPRTKSKLHRVTWWTRHDEKQPELSDDEDKDDVTHDTPDQEPSKLKHRFEVCCGIKEQKMSTLSKEERLALQVKMTSIKENPKWRLILNMNAIILMGITAFIIGFYH